MAWTSKVSNLIKTKAASAIGGKISQALNFASQAQTTKVAAKLLNKSPLEIGTVGPTTHMENVNNPYNYGTVYYPHETANLGDGHYIIFDIVSHKSSKFKTSTFDNGKLVETGESTLVGENGNNIITDFKTKTDRISNLKARGVGNSSRLRGVKSGIMSKVDAEHDFISDSIMLYMPAEALKYGYAASYEDVQTGLAGDLGQALGGMMNDPGFLNKLKAAGKGSTGVMGEVAKSATFAAIGMIPGFENARQLYDKSLGQAKNPNLEMIFQSVPFRSFSFPFVFAPKNLKEKDDVHKILQMFRFHMLPEKQNSSITNGYFTVPSEFQITYMYRDKENSYLPRISRCVLKECNIDYAPEGVISSFIPDEKGAPPTIIKMDLTFGETEIMTKHTVAEGF
jgi:hypothetical protein